MHKLTTTALEVVKASPRGSLNQQGGTKLRPPRYPMGSSAACSSSRSSSGTTFFTTTGPICLAMGVPVEALPLLLAVETVPDIFRTVGNVTADMGVARILDQRAAD